MNSNRLEAFSDGVLAIIITIMVLEMKDPHCTDIEDGEGTGKRFKTKSFTYSLYCRNYRLFL